MSGFNMSGKNKFKYKRVRLSRKYMLEYLRKIFFEWVFSSEEISCIYKAVTGKKGVSTIIISRCGRYKLEVRNKKILRIYLQNMNYGVIYYYNVKVRMLWKEQVEDQFAEAILMQTGRVELFGVSVLENYPSNALYNM